MNKVLELKGYFEHLPKGTIPGKPTLPKKDNPTIKSEKLRKIVDCLIGLENFWENNNIIDGALVQVNYDRVLAKSHRISALLSENSYDDLNKKIVGAKFRKEDKIKHSIVYYVNRKAISNTISKLYSCIEIIEENFDSSIEQEKLDSIVSKDKRLKNKISKTMFTKMMVDSYFVESFSLPDYPTETSMDELIVTFYDVNNDIRIVFDKLKIDFQKFPEKINDNTYLLSKKQYNDIVNKAPYIISMELNNISNIKFENKESRKENKPTIPKPINEPYIGVLDWPFSKDVYFSEWVEYKNETGLDEEYIMPIDRIHGTRVDSIIVDGSTNNKNLDDGCGRFRVKHFGIAYGEKVATKDVLIRIRKVVSENKDIKVWNLSIGSDREINDNYISPIAAELDKLQYEYDVIFIVAGTNDENAQMNMKIGDPADSINSIVVNSVSFDNKIAEFSRKGPVLSFYAKPDVCYYGGSKNSYITVWDQFGKAEVKGTSFAAPWITRKVAFLMYKMRVSKEIAKAIIIDSTLSWDKNDNPSEFYGHGIVPINIKDILLTKEDEIKFFISEVATKYDNSSYAIPVPINNNYFPYVSRATLCYFSNCSRNQGVDYNNIELDLHFGRLLSTGLKTINDNTQNDDGIGFMDEENARKFYRKWDNTKIISEKYSSMKKEKKVDGSKTWGLSIKKTGRFREANTETVNYGIVITLKEINGKNRLHEFLRICNSNGWVVNELDIDNRNTIYINSEEDIKLE